MSSTYTAPIVHADIKALAADVFANGLPPKGRPPWSGEGEKTCQTLANSERQTAFHDEGLPPC